MWKYFLNFGNALNLRFWEIRIFSGHFSNFINLGKYLHGRTIREPEISKISKSSNLRGFWEICLNS